MNDNDRDAPGPNRREVIAGASAALAAASLSGGASAAVPADPVVETTHGRIRGRSTDGVAIFKGIPYGASTAGPGRFRAPRPPAAWTGVRDALAFGHACPQASSTPPPPQPGRPRTRSITGVDPSIQSEDCLVLNVWTKALTGKKPVLFWLHGGGFAIGSASIPLYDGYNLVSKRDVVLVSINHRLNVFGYTHLDQVSNGDYVDSGNAGILDCVLALQWVRDNIARFGGDPGNVTIFGESGGGAKVATLMGMVPAKGLFHKAIIQSGPQIRVSTPEAAHQRALKLLSSLNIDPKDCRKLEDVPVDALLKAGAGGLMGGGGGSPVAGTPALPNHPFDPIASPLSANVPLMIGTTRTETSAFMGYDPAMPMLDDAGLLQRLQRAVPPGEAPKVVDLYRRLYPKAKNDEILYMVTTDRSSFLNSTILADRKVAQGGAPVYFFQFYRESPVDGGRYHSPHGSELPFVFDTLTADKAWVDQPRTLPATQRLADEMTTAWANFARFGNPNGGIVPRWPKYEPATRATMVFDEAPAGSRVVNDERGEQRKLMLGYGMSASPI
jgi:para-nitrobenzyl esterase